MTAQRRWWHAALAAARWTRSHLALWMLAAGAADTAVIALIAELLARPGQSASAVNGLILLSLVPLALSVAFPVVGSIVEERDKEAEERRKQIAEAAAEREQARRELAGGLLARGASGQLPQLRELADDALGVTPTRYTIAGQAPYVTRMEADEKIRGMLAAPGPPYPFVIVWGTTKAGKSRTLAEALRASFPHDTAVVLPRSGQALVGLARPGMGALLTRRPAVVVLDDLDPAGLEALAPDVLEQVRQWAVIAATMTARRRAEVLATGSDVGAVARAALAAASGEYELASGPPAGAERAQAERLTRKSASISLPRTWISGGSARAAGQAGWSPARWSGEPRRHRAGATGQASGC